MLACRGILESYIRLNRLEDANRVIERFKHVIEDMAISKEPWLKEKMHLDFRYANALLHCKCHQFEQRLIDLLEVAALSNRIGNIERFKKCLLAFWHYRFYSAPHHEEKYIQLLSSNNTINLAEVK